MDLLHKLDFISFSGFKVTAFTDMTLEALFPFVLLNTVKGKSVGPGIGSRLRFRVESETLALPSGLPQVAQVTASAVEMSGPAALSLANTWACWPQSQSTEPGVLSQLTSQEASSRSSRSLPFQASTPSRAGSAPWGRRSQSRELTARLKSFIPHCVVPLVPSPTCALGLRD